MKLSEVGELALLETLRKNFTKKTVGLVLGIGDDAAVISPRGKQTLLATDMMVEGVHFDLDWTTPYQAGFKLVSVNVSDIYAMGGRPRFLLLNFAAGENTDIKVFKRLFDGVELALKTYNITLIGGDIASSGEMVLSATVIGHSDRILRRCGARRGDNIYVTGRLGDAAAGLELMKIINRPVEIEKNRTTDFPLKWDIIKSLIERHLMPVARRPVKFADKASSMIDISDGLLLDLSRICAESKTGARIFLEKIPISDGLLKAAEYLGTPPHELALGGGEDYELLFTAPAREKVDAFCIGEITGRGLKIIDKTGKAEKFKLKGYRHFAG